MYDKKHDTDQVVPGQFSAITGSGGTKASERHKGMRCLHEDILSLAMLILPSVRYI
jgi:hypothetical protein